MLTLARSLKFNHPTWTNHENHDAVEDWASRKSLRSQPRSFMGFTDLFARRKTDIANKIAALAAVE